MEDPGSFMEQPTLIKEERLKLLDKLQKLFNMATQNASPNEAEIANRILRQMMDEYNITIDEITEIKDGNDVVARDKIDMSELSKDYWPMSLAANIASFYDCKIVTHRKTKSFSIIGFDLDRKVTTKMWKWIFYNIQISIYKKVAEGELNMWTGKDYGMGATIEIGKRLTKLKEEMTPKVVQTSTALMVLKQSEIKKFLETEFPHLGHSNINIRMGEAYYQGSEYGRNVSLFEQNKMTNQSTNFLR